MNTSRFKALIFDMDGTLTVPSLSFSTIRQETGILEGDLVDGINKLPPPERERAWAIVRRHEADAMLNQKLQEGSLELLERCRLCRVKTGVLTRNERASVDHLCRRYHLAFDAVIAREFPFVKPHPAPVRHMLAEWRIAAGEVLMVGDYLHDIECGRAAGTRTCFFQNPGLPFYGEKADFVVSSMVALADIVWPTGAKLEIGN